MVRRVKIRHDNTNSYCEDNIIAQCKNNRLKCTMTFQYHVKLLVYYYSFNSSFIAMLAILCYLCISFAYAILATKKKLFLD